MPVGAFQRLSIVITPATEAKRTAHVDGPIRPGEVELVHRLHGESWRETTLHRLRLSQRDHVRRDVGTVDVEAVCKQRQKDPPRSAPKVERRLPKPSDRRSEVSQLLGLRHVELGPPTCHQAVMPRPELVTHGRTILRTTPTVRPLG